MTGYEALDARSEIQSLGEKKFIQNQLRSKEIEPANIQMNNLEDIDEALRIDYSIPAQIETAGDIIYIQPFIKKHFEENPFKETKIRLYPIDFLYPFKEYFTFNITIPENFTIESLPKNIFANLQNNVGFYSYDIRQIGNMLVINSKIVLTESYFLPSYYHFLKEMFDQILIKQNEQIVLKKKE